MEHWKPIASYEDCYEVSDHGRVKSLRRGIILSPILNGGYFFVSLCVDGIVKINYIHKLVLEAFVEPRPPGTECCHGDGVKTNNKLENLRWGTRSENQMDRVKHGVSNRGERCGSSKLTEWDVGWIRKFLKHGFAGQRYLARVFGVNEATIRKIKKRERWGWLEV